MMRRALAAGLAIAGTGTFLATTGAGAEREVIEFSDARLKVEVNATDGDAGLQLFVDGEAWRSFELRAPDGRTVVDVATRGSVRDYGLTELFSESSEPPFNEFPIEEFMALFPEGEYAFVGVTIDGTPMEGEFTLTHDFPDGPEIVFPVEGGTVPASGFTAEWSEVTTPAGIEIDGYQVLVVREDPLRVFSADLPATARSLPIPAEILEPGVEYKVEVLAIEASGNQTLTEVSFTVQ